MISPRCVWVNGPIIVGAGPSGMAVAALLKEEGVPFLVLERADCVASLWQKYTYDRVKLQLPKYYCELPKFPFPDHYPDILSREQFVEYLLSYADRFDINPFFNQCVKSASYVGDCQLWRVKTVSTTTGYQCEFIFRSLVVASGEHAEPTVPEIEGLKDQFGGEVIHSRDYKSGLKFKGKNVLVVGCGLSGKEISLDLCHHQAKPWMVVRSAPYHKLPDNILEKIGSDEIQLAPGINRFYESTVELANGQNPQIDSVVLATGYHSNVRTWLQESEFFTDKGLPKMAYPNGWKGKAGLYAVGFTMRGLSGASADAIKTSQDITNVWKDLTKQKPRRKGCKCKVCKYAKKRKVVEMEKLWNQSYIF